MSLILPRSYITKPNVKLKHSKFSPSSLQLPCAINVKDSNNQELIETFNTINKLGATTLFQEPFCDDTLINHVKDLRSNREYGSMVLLSLRFTNSGALRLSFASSRPSGVRVIYDTNGFNELANNLDTKLPLVTD